MITDFLLSEMTGIGHGFLLDPTTPWQTQLSWDCQQIITWDRSSHPLEYNVSTLGVTLPSCTGIWSSCITIPFRVAKRDTRNDALYHTYPLQISKGHCACPYEMWALRSLCLKSTPRGRSQCLLASRGRVPHKVLPRKEHCLKMKRDIGKSEVHYEQVGNANNELLQGFSLWLLWPVLAFLETQSHWVLHRAGMNLWHWEVIVWGREDIDLSAILGARCHSLCIERHRIGHNELPCCLQHRDSIIPVQLTCQKAPFFSMHSFHAQAEKLWLDQTSSRP